MPQNVKIVLRLTEFLCLLPHYTYIVLSYKKGEMPQHNLYTDTLSVSSVIMQWRFQIVEMHKILSCICNQNTQFLLYMKLLWKTKPTIFNKKR